MFSYEVTSHRITTGASPMRCAVVTCDPNPVPNGQGSTCTAIPNQGYEVAGWTGCDSFNGGSSNSNSCSLIDVTQPRTVTVNCSAVQVVGAPIPVMGRLDLLLSALGLGLVGGWRIRRKG